MDYALRQMALTWRVILPALGHTWFIEEVRDGGVEIAHGVVTVFIEIQEKEIEALDTSENRRHNDGHSRERRRRRRQDDDRDTSPKRGTLRVPTLDPVTPKGSEFSKGIRSPTWPKHSGSEFIMNCRDLSGQIIAASHDLTPNGGLVREIPLFQGNLGW